MQTRFASALVAAVAALTLTSFAATPIALWDGANTDLGNFSLTAQNGNTIQNNVITIASDATGGVVYTGPNSSLNNCTFIIRCSGLDFANANNQYLLSLHQNILGGGNGDASYNKVGVSLAANNAAVRGIWENGFYSDNGDNCQCADPFSSGTDIAINIQTSGGVFVYEIVTDANTGVKTLVKRYGHTSLKASNTNYKGFSLGGIYDKTSSTLSSATGWTISKMAVFGSTLSEADILSYCFASEIDTIAVDSNTSVSALNALIAASSGRKIVLSVAGGVMIDVDTAFVASVPVEIASTGNVTLSAASQPDASYFSAVDFSGMQGALFRSWLPSPGVVGFNFNANGGRNNQGNADGAANTSLALEIGTWYKDAYSPSGSSTAMFADGISKLTWQANNVYAETSGLTDGTFIQGYLDDGGNVSIRLSAVPYETYDVIIYCSTDDSNKSFKAKTVNGTIYTWDSTAGATTTTSSDAATWGLASAAAGKAVYGANTLRINNLTGQLSILGGTNGNNARGCISAIQIMPAGTSTAPEMTVGTAGQTTQATWSGATWNVATAPTSGNVVVNVSGDVELTIDETVALSAITVVGEGSLKIIPDQPNNVTFTSSSISSAIPLLFANDGIGIDTISAEVTYIYKTASINSLSLGSIYTSGVGQQGSSVAISHNGGSVTLQGATYYLGESHNGTATTVIFDDATAVYADCGIGMATYSVEGSSSITAQRLILSQGADGRTAVMTVKDTASVSVTGTSDVDSNQSSIMFGHWNGPSTFTIQDSATFTAASQILVGKTRNDHTININGGTFTANGIKASASASGTNMLNLNGGVLVLGDVGITSYSTSTHISVNVNSNTEVRASASELPISQDVAISSDKVLSLTKAEGVSAAVVSVTGAVSGEGSVSVAEGVTLNLGTLRPTCTFTVDGVLALTLASKADVITLNASKPPASVFLYDVDGTTLISGANVSYDNGTLTVVSHLTWTNTLGDGKFDSVGNWNPQTLPGNSDDVVVSVTGNTAITVDNGYTVDEFTVAGGGAASFSGVGSVSANTAYVIGGSTLDTNGKVTFQNLSLESSTTGIVASVDGLANGGLTGTGTFIIDPGEGVTNTMSSANTSFTGEAVIKSGTVKMGDATSFGPYNGSSVVHVLAGAAIDTYGCAAASGDGATRGTLVLEPGATYTATASTSDPEKFPFSTIRLQGDASFDSDYPTGLSRTYYDPTTLSLEAYRLTKVGSGTLYLAATTISGSGELYVEEGVLSVRHGYWHNANNQCSCDDGTIRIGPSAILDLEYYNRNDWNQTNSLPVLRVKNLVLDGVVTKNNDRYSSNIRISGSITGNGTTPILTLGANARFKPTGTGYLTITESLTLPTKTVSEEEVPYMVIDLTDALASGASSIPLFRVGSAENLPDAGIIGFIYPGQTVPSQDLPRGWSLSTTQDGCGYRLSKGGFYIRLR